MLKSIAKIFKKTWYYHKTQYFWIERLMSDFIYLQNFSMKKMLAECIGTMVLVVFGCGVAVWTGVDPVATALAFWLVIVALAYAIWPVSGCHVNPAVSLWVYMTGWMSAKEFWKYVCAQFVGGIIWAALLAVMFGCDFTALWANGLDWVNGSILLGLLAEIVLTFVFVMAVLWATSKSENWSVAGIVIGLSLTLVHLLWLGLTWTSVNPARSFGPALFQGLVGWDWSFCIVRIFIVAPMIWAALAALLFNYFKRTK